MIYSSHEGRASGATIAAPWYGDSGQKQAGYHLYGSLHSTTFPDSVVQKVNVGNPENQVGV